MRHSSVFAFPAILSRLKPDHRRSLALETMNAMCKDESETVRTGVLESLGEVLYTFHRDRTAPPEELIELFLGRREDRRLRDVSQSEISRIPFVRKTPLDSFYDDPARPLICAFNYPAVALALGQDRWPDLRETYLKLAQSRELGVRRTLAASLGELAKIIGEENTAKDLMVVWWDSIRSLEADVRIKAIECVVVFVAALGPERFQIVEGLLTVWEEGGFRSWREREAIGKALMSLTRHVGRDVPMGILRLLRKALEDHVAAVRESALSAVSRPYQIIKC